MHENNGSDNLPTTQNEDPIMQNLDYLIGLIWVWHNFTTYFAKSLNYIFVITGLIKHAVARRELIVIIVTV